MQMRTKRTQTLLNVLAITTINPQIIKDAKTTFGIRRNKQPALDHILHKQNGFQYHRFTPCIWTADNHDALIAQDHR